MVLPRFFLFSDPVRLPDPGLVLKHLPRGAGVVLRHSDVSELTALARRIIPQAHRLGLTVLLANQYRLAQQLGADGVHLSERAARLARRRNQPTKPGFLITAAAHHRLALYRAQTAGAHAVFLSPVFATKSHPGARPLGLWRFLTQARLSPVAVVALGGVNAQNFRRVCKDWNGPVFGFAAIDGWRTDEAIQGDTHRLTAGFVKPQRTQRRHRDFWKYLLLQVLDRR